MRNIFKSRLLHKDSFHDSNKFDGIDRLLSIEDMEKAVLREKARSDRQNHEFSMIVVDIEELNHGGDLINRLLSFLDTRLRSIDEIGWYDRYHIGIILPYTSKANAIHVVEEITATLQIENSDKLLKILSYPSIWPFKK